MAGPRIFGFLVLLWQVFNIHCQAIDPPPVVDGMYRAMGEMTVNVEIFSKATKNPIQVTFEENYDPENQMAAFTIWELGQNSTFIENFRTQKTFQYTDNMLCQEVTKKDWIDIESPPSLMGFSSDGKIRFAIQKLLTVDSKYLKQASTKEIYRGIPANMWQYEMAGKEGDLTATVSIYAYWSDPSWNTTGGAGISVPLGYKITKIIHNETVETETQTINVFAFNRGVINKAEFEAREGLYCQGNVTNEFSFPVMPKIDAISIRSEIAINNYLEVKYIDTWYDMKNKLLRIDMDLIKDQEPGYLSNARRITSQFTSKDLGQTFEIDIYRGKLTCEVINLDKYKFEAQDIINPKLDAKYWDMYHFFGVNSTNYRYIGKTTKRNIPCHMFQGNRTDWPEESSGTVSLWEWCLAVNFTNKAFLDDYVEFRENELPIVSLKIYFLKSTDEDFPNGSTLVHHFYGVVAENPDEMYSSSFDISRCFNSTNKKELQFAIDVELNENNTHILENATSNPVFLQLWRDQMYQATKLTKGSLRITRVRSAIYNNVMFVTFTLLGVHPELPDKSKHRSLEDVEKDLRDAVDKGALEIKYCYWRQKCFDLKSQNGTLLRQIDPTRIPHEGTTTTTGLPVTTPTLLPVTTEEPEIDSKKGKIPGHSPGTVAGVTVAMLLVGITLGAGGIFYKHRGLPQSCRRAG